MNSRLIIFICLTFLACLSLGPQSEAKIKKHAGLHLFEKNYLSDPQFNYNKYSAPKNFLTESAGVPNKVSYIHIKKLSSQKSLSATKLQTPFDPSDHSKAGAGNSITASRIAATKTWSRRWPNNTRRRCTRGRCTVTGRGQQGGRRRTSSSSERLCRCDFLALNERNRCCRERGFCC